MRELAKRDPSFADTLKKKTYAKLGRDHPDLRAVRPCPVPLVIVGNKYDIFKVSTVPSRSTPAAITVLPDLAFERLVRKGSESSYVFKPRRFVL